MSGEWPRKIHYGNPKPGRKIENNGTMKAHSSEIVKEARRRNHYRFLRTLDSPSEPWVTIEGQRYLLMSSNNYLGLSTHTEVVGRAAEAVREFGAGAGASRLVSGNNRLVEELEAKLAAWKKKERALVFSSGYMTSVGVISALVGSGDAILSDRLNHASLIDGCRLSGAKVFKYNHANALDLLRNLKKAKDFEKILIVTDGVFSMEGTLAPLGDIVKLKEDHGAWLMVDDAHGTGVIGAGGTGAASYCGVEDGVDVVMGTLSKALGSQGGFIAADGAVVEHIINTSRPFIYSTGIAPPCAAAALAAIDVIERNFDELSGRLKANADRLRNGLREIGFDVADGPTPIIPLVVGEAEAALQFADALMEAGVYAPAIRPPSVPKGRSRIRVAVMATHTGEDIDRAIGAFQKAGRKTGMIK